jgi:hypothetical protein
MTSAFGNSCEVRSSRSDRGFTVDGAAGEVDDAGCEPGWIVEVRAVAEAGRLFDEGVRRQVLAKVGE